MEEYAKNNTKGRIWRTVAIIAVGALFLLLLIVSITSKPTPGDQVWNESATIGNLEAENYYIMYTDLMCPYCDVFSREAMNNWADFEQFLADNDVLFEIRLTDYLYEGSGIQASRDSAEAAYCATRENKFWDYYHEAISSLWRDYHSKGIGSSKNAPRITDMPDDYWLQIGHRVGLGEQFDNCVKNHDTVAELEYNTRRALQTSNGMPYFKFNRFTTSGFDSNWDYEYVKQYLNAGLTAR